MSAALPKLSYSIGSQDLDVPPRQKANSIAPMGDQQFAAPKAQTNLEDSTMPKPEKNKAHFSDLMLKTDLHGLPDLYESFVHKKMCQIMTWLIIVIAAVTLFAWQVFMTWKDFRDNPILTTYSLVNHEDGLPFPNVYVCLNNPIHHGQLMKSNVDPQWLKENLKDILTGSSISGLSGVLAAKSGLASALIGVVVPEPLPPPPVVGTDNSLGPCERRDPYTGEKFLIIPCNFTSTTSTTTTTTTTTTTPSVPWIPRDAEEFLMRVGYPEEDLFEECAWQSSSLDCQKYVQPVYDTNYGKCFSISFSETNQTVAGAGLSFVLNLDPENSLSFKRSAAEHYPVSLFDGVIIQVAPQGASIMLSETKTSVGSGTNTKLSLEATHMTLIDAASLNQFCIDGDDADELLKIFGTSYSANLCEADCVAQELYSQCNCILPTDRRSLLDHMKNADFCSVNQTKICVTNASRSDTYKETVRKCFKSCHIACSVWQLRLDTSSTPFPSPMFEDAVADVYESYHPEKQNFCEIKPYCSINQEGPIAPSILDNGTWVFIPDVFKEKPWYWDSDAMECVQFDCWTDEDTIGAYYSKDDCRTYCDPCVGYTTGDYWCYGEQTLIWAYAEETDTCENIWHGYCDLTNNNHVDEKSCIDLCWHKNHYPNRTVVEDFLPNYGGGPAMSPFYGDYGGGSSSYGGGSPSYGGGSPSYGGGSPSYGGGSPSYGGGSPSYGGGSPSYGGGSPSYGGGSPSYGGGSPSYGGGSPSYGSYGSGPPSYGGGYVGGSPSYGGYAGGFPSTGEYGGGSPSYGNNGVPDGADYPPEYDQYGALLPNNTVDLPPDIASPIDSVDTNPPSPDITLPTDTAENVQLPQEMLMPTEDEKDVPSPPAMALPTNNGETVTLLPELSENLTPPPDEKTIDKIAVPTTFKLPTNTDESVPLLPEESMPNNIDEAVPLPPNMSLPTNTEVVVPPNAGSDDIISLDITSPTDNENSFEMPSRKKRDTRNNGKRQTRTKRQSDNYQPEPNDDIKQLQRRRYLRSKYKWQDRIVVDVAFNHLQYITIDQSPSMTFSTFVGNIGGQCGLWLGASIISCVKIFIIIGPLLGNGIRACFRRQQ